MLTAHTGIYHPGAVLPAISADWFSLQFNGIRRLMMLSVFISRENHIQVEKVVLN
jgi:hypothetical protein